MSILHVVAAEDALQGCNKALTSEELHICGSMFLTLTVSNILHANGAKDLSHPKARPDQCFKVSVPEVETRLFVSTT